jgi:hypothetical protein
MIFVQLGVANNLSTFDNQYWTHERELERLRAVANPDARQRQLIRAHKESMEAAESRIAGALAAWKLFEFMYPEYARDPGSSRERSEMRNVYATFTRSMRFEVYVKRFASQMQSVMKQMDADFLMQDQAIKRVISS